MHRTLISVGTLAAYLWSIWSLFVGDEIYLEAAAGVPLVHASTRRRAGPKGPPSPTTPRGAGGQLRRLSDTA